MAKTLFQENRVFYYITLITWLSSAVCGIFCAINLGSAPFDDICAYVKGILGSEISTGEFIKLGIKENVSFFLLLTVFSSAPVFMPLTLAVCAFKGFSAGFTSMIIIRIYAIKGALLSLGAVVIPYAFSMPVIFMMTVAALRFSIGNLQKKPYGHPTAGSGEWFSHILFLLVLTFLLSLITIAESFMSKLVTGLVI